ncbi:MAG TPA: ATP-binding protein [Actinocrinis sp.]|uniref:ATP-binding protein n=1 Tax=Actinocrinis sp. TaxID=1920516 RepID=UPI002DDC9DBE|nr:ATP-binding protein [Actinocrinis sp.]HEV2345642.1 ATP-binding protein [Actinocrinis sp.]
MPDPRLARLLAAMRAVRDGDLAARAEVSGDDELAELGALFDLLAGRNQTLTSQALTGQASTGQVPSGRAAGLADGEVPGRGHEPTTTADVAGAASGAGSAARAEQSLERREREIAAKVTQVEQAQLSLRERDQQLMAASKAKAEFLANISQELRTPLSSVLILAKLLAANAEGNLTPRQLDFANTIHGAAQDLLHLINDLLDLSKVESGQLEVRAEHVAPARLVAEAEAAFRPQAAEKGLELNVRIADDTPRSIATDEYRLQQILRNLLSNAVKFTEHGSVTLEVSRDPDEHGLLRFAVRDTGIGIAAQRQQAVFDPFQHGDAFSGQRFVGTGLGLSISRELARLLGGSLAVRSTPGQGSTFTLTLPVVADPDVASPADRPATPAEEDEDYGLGSQAPQAGVLLVAEPRRARAMQHAARSALDGLTGMRGRVEVLTVHDGASDEVRQALTGREVVGALVNLSMPQAQVQSLLSTVAEYAPAVPVLAYEAGAGSGAAARLEAPAGAAPRIEIVGSRAQAVERLTLHLLTALPGSAIELSLNAEQGQSTVRFHGEKVLVVDDDVRNVFAMTSMLELHGLSVVHADNGRQGIETLLANPDIRLVLMDLMMPGMDGYTAIEYIRSLEQFAGLPIIAVTAKAMRGDRERSLAAGANEHVVKPVEVDVLLSVIGTVIGG